MPTNGSAQTNNFPFGFKFGLLLRGLPLVQSQPGRAFWVSNSTTLMRGEVKGSNANDGSFFKPFATIQRALDMCQANHGDIVFVKPGHAETIADAATLTFNKAGVAIIGLGYGSQRPTLTFTAATANIPTTAANCSIQNILFKANFADVASVFTATGTATPTDLNIEGCEFRDGSSVLNFISLFTGNATANSCDGFRFFGNRVSSLGTTAATTALKLLSNTDRIVISENFGTSAVLNDTAALLAASTFQLTNFELRANVWERPNTSSTGGSFVSGSGNAWTGMASDNYFYQVDNTAGIWISTGHGSAFGYQNNFSPITGAVDKSGLINPAAV
jgi:hypothetical protein